MWLLSQISIHLKCSLLVAIGIEAFNKFSQEQKAEIEEEEENTSSDVISSNREKKTKFNLKSYLRKVIAWTGAALSSTRVWEL